MPNALPHGVGHSCSAQTPAKKKSAVSCELTLTRMRPPYSAQMSDERINPSAISHSDRPQPVDFGGGFLLFAVGNLLCGFKLYPRRFAAGKSYARLL